MSVTGTKRKWSVLKLERKFEIKELEKGFSQRVVGDKFGVAKSTVRDVWKERKRYLMLLLPVNPKL